MAKISDQTFSTALQLEQALIEAGSRGDLVLTSTSRLSRRLLHCYRLERIMGNDQGWKTPAIFGFNRWVKETYELLWEPFRPLSRLESLCIWDEAVRSAKKVEGLRPGPFLSLQLQDSFDALMRSAQAVGGSPGGHTLADWRREVSCSFLALLQRNQYVTWGDILKKVGEVVEEGKVTLPERIMLAGFNELSPLEEGLVKSMAKRSEVSLCCPAIKPDAEGLRVRVFATPEQECQSVCAEVIESWNKGQKRLGVVFLDRDYFSLLKRYFEELTDREERPPDALRYNLTTGIPLSSHPLFETALLPLRLPDEVEPNRLISSLLFSPYARRLEPGRDTEARSSLWRQGGLQKAEDILPGLNRKGFPLQPLLNLCFFRSKRLRAWLQELENLWKNLGLFVLRCETDTLAREHLSTIFEDLKEKAGHLKMGRKDVLAWITAASRGVEVVEKTVETAGIQVLNLVESRGLAFDSFWVVGTHGHVLPKTVSENVFLDPEELRKTEGGTVEKQWESGQKDLSWLLSGSPKVIFSRAASKGGESPFLPCPLIPDESSEEGQQYTINLWKDPPQEWARARWLREGLKGLGDASIREGENAHGEVGIPLTGQVNVIDFENLLLCPFKYFAGKILGLESLEEPKLGIDARERGHIIHQILREFTLGLARAAPGWPDDKEGAFQFLAETTDRILGKRLEDLFWKVERTRLLGEGRSPGLLETWLDREQERGLDGWRFETAEASFGGLSIEGTDVTLKGRFDRLDVHPEKGKALWDYKTGSPPARKEVIDLKVRPQIPAYLLALKTGLLSGIGGWKGETEAGYIVLKRASDVKVEGLKKVEWESFLGDWMKEAGKRIERPLKGIYEADPKPPPSPGNDGGCQYCDFSIICGYETQKEKTEDDEGEEE